MPKILVFQHVPHEPLGTLNPLLRDHGIRIRYVNFGRSVEARPNLDGYHGLVVLGGPMNVDQVADHPHLTTEVELIQQAIERDMPVLGICLGAQLTARALGASVRANPEKEIGWVDVELTEAGRGDDVLGVFQERERIFQWHGDTFEIPAGAVHLAKSAACANQAFRFGSRVYGLQFHLEVDHALIERWLRVPVHQEELRELGGRVDPQAIREETTRVMARAKLLADEVFRAWIGLFAETRARDRHPHA